MKRCLQIIAAYFVCCFLNFSFAEGNVRVSAQFLEISQNTLLELLNDKENSSSNLYKKIMALPKEKQGITIETAVVTTQLADIQARVQTHVEMIYQTDVEPGMTSYATEQAGFGIAPEKTNTSPRAGYGCPLEFETRYCGTNLEIMSTSRVGSNHCALEFGLYITKFMHDETFIKYIDQWGDASHRRPIFETWRKDSLLTVPVGKFELVTTFTPQNNRPIPAPLTKVLVFVRCDFVQ